MSGHTGQVPDTLVRRGDWVHQSLCQDMDTETFFTAAQAQNARRTCLVCPVLEDCQRWVMAVESGVAEEFRFGVVAALTAAERAALDPIVQERQARLQEKKRAKAAAAVTAGHEPKPEPSPAPAPKPKPKPKPVPKPEPDAAPKPRRTKPPAKCPSNSAYMRHLQRGEPIDDGCRAEHARVTKAARYSKREKAVYAPWSRGLSDPDIAAATGLSPVVVRRTRARLGLMPNNPKATS